MEAWALSIKGVRHELDEPRDLVHPKRLGQDVLALQAPGVREHVVDHPPPESRAFRGQLDGEMPG